MFRFGLLLVLSLLSSVTTTDDKASVTEPALQAELLRRTKVDQEARGELVKLMQSNGPGKSMSKEQQAEFAKLAGKMKVIDSENTRWLKGVVAKQGWPTIAMVGKDGSQSAWLLVQHADADLKFQRQCLDLMTKLPKDAISQKNLAYLTDRVLCAEGKKQIYGTQFATIDGKMECKPLEDEANVDKRRAEIGLGTMAEYRKILDQQYRGKK